MSEATEKVEEKLGVKVLRIGMILLVMAIGVFGWVEGSTYTATGARFPLFLSAGIVILGTGVLVKEVRTMRRGGAHSTAAYDYEVDGLTPIEVLRRGATWLALLIGYVIMLWLVGYMATTVTWLILSLRIGARLRWLSAIIAAIIATALLEVVIQLLNVPLPMGLFYVGI
ncbi:hypothetical protein Aple_036070 [Acrocarpospora pleiomorpha]|uniref:DUF1468 domain-containing protein n=1 Tax=Acrocarpospora pleiomorpha TaxID=90975 RepID=A0A5M3XM49_9ACTN|nr:tripartite tricarboxylate transporter TctB family protein [Acrocarpospora pleiomorpha]GES20711.1 hypothetical protein Aple_036070 [Acrocarpospora pleiomorpha]